ncbi:MAG: alpha/beta hydrolase-fold protein [Acidimicrobiia bacterium]|nr:alpha/beta hydrolase-fold protein [Acidimicrobiia bacterium]
MSRVSTTWYSDRVKREVRFARWGEFGIPVLCFPTAGGDAEEIERMLMVDALAPILEAGRIKLYSVDSVSGKAWLGEYNKPPFATRMQTAFDSFLLNEVLPAIYNDCGGRQLDVIVAGASLGAYNALAAICRHPDRFSQAVCLSGTYDLARFIEGEVDQDWYHASPLHFVPNLDEGHPQLAALRTRFVVLAHGRGKWEDGEESWRVADVLGARGVPNRVDEWGPEWDHDWPTWRAMLPHYLDDLVPN